MTDDETLTLRATVIGGKRHPDDYTVIWRELPNVYRPDQANAEPTGRHRQWKQDQGCL
jgi:hypothetical protein